MKRRPAQSVDKPRRRLAGPIHERIRARRLKLGLSQQDLADTLGVDKTAVSHWENGISCPELSRLEDLATALGTSFHVLLKDLMAREAA